MLVGYYSVFQGEDTAFYKKQLKEAGCLIVFKDYKKRSKLVNKGFQSALASLEKGQGLIVPDFSHVNYELPQLFELILTLEEKSIQFKSLNDNFDSKDGSQSILLEWMRVFADHAKNVRQSQVKKGLEKARKEGRVGGRPKALTPSKQSKMVTLIKQQLSVEEICKKLNISRATYYRYS